MGYPDVDFGTYDNDTNPCDDDYFEFVEWLEDLTVAELRRAGGDPHEQRQAVLRYWKRGCRAHLGPSELIDFLGGNTPSILDLAGCAEEEGDAIMQISDSVTEDEIGQTLLPM